MTGFSLIWIIVMLVALYFMMIRPQQKEAKRKNAMMAELAVGDTILTTSGFYGIVIDITEDTVMVFWKADPQGAAKMYRLLETLLP